MEHTLITVLIGVIGLLGGFGLSQIIGMQNVKADRVRLTAVEGHVDHLVRLMTAQTEQNITLLAELKAARE